MNEIMMTVLGNLVDDPVLHETRSGHKVANFRLASTARRFDRDAGRWQDSGTFFVSVSAWRALGEHAAASLRKGQPVIVYGRYQTRTYEKDQTTRVAHEIEAISIGPDLNRGTATWSRANRAMTSYQVDTDAQGIPVNGAEAWLQGTPAARTGMGTADMGTAGMGLGVSGLDTSGLGAGEPGPEELDEQRDPFAAQLVGAAA